jgi:pSer/pThr/pTyr-binding forkhead associated (FHA) protein
MGSVHSLYVWRVPLMSRLYVLNGPEIGKSFQLKEGANNIGRSMGNDIPIQDGTVSREHLRIVKKADGYFATDLGSHNGTLIEGNYLTPGAEVEVKEGVPIAIGMTVLGIGETSLSLMMPFLDTASFTREAGDESGIFAAHKDKTNQKKLETLYRVADVFEQKLPLKDALEKVLDVVTELLGHIDTAAFILIDPKTTKVALFSHRSKEWAGRPAPKFCPQVVYRVMTEKKAVMVPNSEREDVETELAETLKNNGISSVMCIPVISSSEVVGVIYLHTLKSPYGFRIEDVSLFEDIAQRTGGFIRNGQPASKPPRVMEEAKPKN